MNAFSATAEFGTAEIPSAALSLSCDGATFVASGKAAQAARAVAAAAFTLAGVAVVAVLSLPAANGAFAASGRPIAAPIVSVAAGASYAVTGRAVAAAIDNQGAGFLLTGQPVALKPAIAAAARPFVVTGLPARAYWATPAVAYVFAGQDAEGGGNTPLDGASFTMFGKPVFRTWTIGFGVPGEPATAEYGTAEFPLRQLYQLDARGRAFAWSGADALLTAAPEAAAFVLGTGRADMAIGVDPAAFALGGQVLLTRVAIAADRGAFALVPQLLQSLLPLDGRAFVVSGQAIMLRESLFRGTFLLTGQEAHEVKWLGCAPGAFAWSGKASLSTFNIAAARAGFTVLGWSIVDVTGPSGDHIYLIEVQAHDGVALRTFYLGTEGFTSLPSDTPANQFYEPRIADPGNFERALFDGADLRGRAKSGSGDIVVINGDPGNGETLDAWFGYGWSRREIRIKSLPKGARSLSAASTLFVGKLDKIASTKPLEQFSLTISDRLADLQAPLLTALYAGTTLASGATADGNGDLKGKIKQRCWGSCANVPLQAANPYDLIYLASNGAVSSIAVYDGGKALINDGDSANIAVLRSATIAGGHYRTCLTAGLVRVGGLPEKSLTADVVEGATVASRTAGQIAYRMLLAYGVPSNAISTGSIAALDLRSSAECCYFVDNDREAVAAVQDVLDSVGAWMVPDRDGTFVFGRFDAPTVAPQTSFELDAVALGDSLERVDTELPAWRVLVEYAPVFTVQGDNDVLASVSAERRAYLAKDVRTVAAENAAVQEKHLSAREVTVKTYLVDPAAAQVEANRQLALLSAERQRFNVTMPLSDAWPASPGSSITLRNERLGLGFGKPFSVVNRVDQYETDTVQFSLWG